MKERPILFSAPMVRALLAGRKTMTRRLVKHLHAAEIEAWHFNGVSWRFGVYGEGGVAADMGGIHCPHGVEGDRLWVRETWGVTLDAALEQGRNGLPAEARAKVRYAAEGAKEKFGVARWRPSIHMPRWASRIALEVTAVRVERLHAITEEDAVAEGVEAVTLPEEWVATRESTDGSLDLISFERQPSPALLRELRLSGVRHNKASTVLSAREAFERLWCDINGAESWAANPWVWCVSFRKL